MPNKHKNWKYKNTALLAASLLLLIFFADKPAVRGFIGQIGSLGYFGVFVTGMFFVSTFTVAPAVVVLFFLSRQFNPLAVALIAGAGATLGDVMILKFLKDRVFEELSPLFAKVTGSRIGHFFKTPYFAWLSPFIGILIIASPFPDEIGIALLGVSKLKTWQFSLLSFACNSIGIFLIISAGKAL